MIEGSHRSFDRVRCIGLDVTDTDIDELCRNMKEQAVKNARSEEQKDAGKEVGRQQLCSWGVLTEKDGKYCPTNAYAIRELIINAVVHRSYLDHGDIQVAVYVDRLEITSPGKLPMGQTVERMREGYSKIRNEALACAFSYMNLIEHWGSGIPRVIGKVKAAGLKEPELIGGEVDLRVNIYRGKTVCFSINNQTNTEKITAGWNGGPKRIKPQREVVFD